jgi:cytochrome c oxidase subunit III
MCTEILMFGGLFVAYALFASRYPEIFKAGAQFLNWKYGAANTVILLFSSLTIALSVYFLQKNNSKAAAICLFTTLLCAGGFMAIKFIEYTHKFHEHLYPGKYFAHETVVKNLALYFSLYFSMTGLHGLHVLIGMGLITWVLIRTLRGEFNSNYYTPVEGVALFWHLVDLVWIYLFPLLYLV